MSDERKGKMSGSAFPTYSLCPGKYQAELGLPEETSRDAQIGTDFHALMAGQVSEDKYPVDQLELRDTCWKEHDSVIDQIGFAGKTPDVICTEDRLWYGDEWSGQIDRIEIWGNIALVTDWKSGRIAQGSALSSMQLRAYAVLVARKFPQLATIHVALVQPLAADTTVAAFDRFDLQDAEDEIARIIAAAKEPGAKRIPSADACRYCKAKSVCPEAQAETTQLATVEVLMLQSMSSEKLGEFLDRCEIAEDVIDAAKSEAKRRLLAGEEIPGRKLQAGKTTRIIERIQDAFELLCDDVTGLPVDSFVSSCTLSVAKLEESLAEALKLKGKAAKEKLAQVLGDIIQTKTTAPSMVRKK